MIIMAMILATATVVPDVGSQQLHLVCVGAGTGTSHSTSTGSVRDSSGDTSTVTIDQPGTISFSDQLDIDIDGVEGRIRLPRPMIPPINSGKDGWFKLRDVQTSDREIVGKAKVNLLNSPKVRLDRMTGRVQISGWGMTFSGDCTTYDPAATQRRF